MIQDKQIFYLFQINNRLRFLQKYYGKKGFYTNIKKIDKLSNNVHNSFTKSILFINRWLFDNGFC